ncbi:ABC transporter ATP-binding protein [Paenibacillus tuaregi]|uniref:ABC transporter ATP-binding protein n=1 Tax=Paenibacillus tuaregi TaxID=1816681 RepID=UPI00083816A6|nr:ATP-binding cassette domain-containing protein [Paenibacillus tuaregi]
MIEVHDIRKSFKTAVVKEGRFSGLRTLFSREYRIKEAVRGISFQVEQGEFVGYIGPNGAGKSTTIKMLTGILHPTSGRVTIAGMNPHQERRSVVKRLGVVFGQRSQLWWDLPVKDSFDILAEMYGVGQADKAGRLRQFTELLDLQTFWDTPVRKLSLGQRMRADLAAAMLHDPDVLFLDEPTIGLDVNAKRNIRQFLKLINEEFGKTILLTTHDMDDIEQLCSRVMVINNGELSYDGTVRSLRDTIGLPTLITVTFRGPFQIPESYVADSCGAESAQIRVTRVIDQTVSIEVNRREINTLDIVKELGKWGELDDIEMQDPDFEDVIHKVY